MQIQSAFSSGLQGLQRASAGLATETQNINRQTEQSRQQVQELNVQNVLPAAESPAPTRDTPSDINTSIVRLEQQQLQGQASVRSLRTADEMLGSIIDVRV